MYIHSSIVSIVTCLAWICYNITVSNVLIYLIHIYSTTTMQIGCAFVAGLLHYFFLASFCWMLCEGVMLYLMMVVVFSKLSKLVLSFTRMGWVLLDIITRSMLPAMVQLLHFCSLSMIFFYSYSPPVCGDCSRLKTPVLWSPWQGWQSPLVMIWLLTCKVYTV